MIDAQKTYQKTVHKIQQVIPKEKEEFTRIQTEIRRGLAILEQDRWNYLREHSTCDVKSSLILEQDHEGNLQEHSTLGRTSTRLEKNYDYVAHATQAYKNDGAVSARGESYSIVFVRNICNQW